jgi:hypothetical protein
VPGAAIWPAQNHPAVPCPQDFHANQRTVRRPHLAGRAKRCTGSLSTIGPVDRPELIFAVESHIAKRIQVQAEGSDAGNLRPAVTVKPF